MRIGEPMRRNDGKGIMSEDWTKAERREMYRRLAYVLEGHPYLSGLQTDEHLRWLSELARRGLRLDEQPEQGEEPHYELELGYDDMPGESLGAMYVDDEGDTRVSLGPKARRAHKALQRKQMTEARDD